MKVTQLGHGLWSLGMEDRYLRVFRDASYTELGMRYNTYLLETDAGYIVLGSLPARFAEEWAETIAAHVGSKDVRWAVFFGVDGDKAALNALKSRWTDLTLILGEQTLCALNALGDKHILIRAKRTICLGSRTLEFHTLGAKGDTVSLYVLEKATKTLWTADAFGADCALGETKVSGLRDLSPWLRGAALYFADIYGGRRRGSMAKAVRLLRENQVETICHAFGPVVDAELDQLLAIYERPEPMRNRKKTMALVYTPDQFLPELAEQIIRGAKESGDIQVEAFDLSAVSQEMVLNALPNADFLLLGLSHNSGDAAKPVWDLLTSLHPGDLQGKFAAVFHTSGLDSPLPGLLQNRLETLGCNLNARNFSVTGCPTEAELNNALDYGFAMGCLMQGIPNPRQPSLVKCLVCGEIFDASLGTCPVCGVGLDQCVPVEEDEAGFKRDTNRNYLIIGGCAAAIAAAAAIRQRDATGTITLLSAEDHLPINRPMLTKGMDVAVNETEMILAHPASWYAERKIKLHLGTAASAIHLESRTVETEDGAVYPYDKLILATGAECFVPPIPGYEKSGVITVRHLSDAQDMWRRMKTARNAVVIGGGVLGLEAAAEFMRSAIPVTVLEATPQIMGRQIDSASAGILMDIMRKAQIDCYQGISVAEIEGETHVTGVRLGDGRVFPADVVVMSCGARANTQLAVAAGIQADRAITVNMFMETNVPDIYACGDCCSYDGVNYQLFQEATEQGTVAGANAAGERIAYRSHLFGTHIEGVGATMFALGDPGKNPEKTYKTVTTTDELDNRHERYWFSGGALRGAVVINADEKIPEITEWVETRARHADIC